jgi:hypothetical protein
LNIKNKTDFFKGLEVFKDWTKTAVTKISYLFKEISFLRNQVVYERNTPSTFVYIVKEGEFEEERPIHIDKKL